MQYLTPTFAVAGQLQPADMAAAKAAGFVAIINNRPEAEERGLPSEAALAAAARAAGLSYAYLPMTSGQLDPDLVAPTQSVMAATAGPVLAFCRSGARSTAMWAMAQAASGADIDTLCAQATAAGYSIDPLRPMLATLAARA